MEKIKEDICDNSISSKVVIPKVGCQYGMYGELLFNPGDLLVTRPTPVELEQLLKNLGEESETTPDQFI